jgi:hypothetical protein
MELTGLREDKMESWYCKDCDETHHEGQTCASSKSKLNGGLNALSKAKEVLGGLGPIGAKVVRQANYDLEAENRNLRELITGVINLYDDGKLNDDWIKYYVGRAKGMLREFP